MKIIPFRRPATREPLDDQLAALPREMDPPRDLWPAIAARLGEQQRPAPRHWHWPTALAAGVAVAAVSAVLTFGLLREPGTPGADSAGEPALVPVSYGPNSALDAGQLQTRDELLAQFRERLAGLPPETREAVLKNLAIIQHAADDIDAALADNPGSGLLNQLLFGTYQEELRIYSQVITAGGDLSRRT
ncbi:MAG: hypothetical protein EPO25_14040 [Gammaproteobacteria bacterium]|nr:MAG: hypothetical protein EPO25_14040 [Gammaproteobacteria bacterium]